MDPNGLFWGRGGSIRECCSAGSARPTAHIWLSPLPLLQCESGCCPMLKYLMAHNYLTYSQVRSSPPAPPTSSFALAAVRHCHFKCRVCPISGSAVKGGGEQLKPCSHTSVQNLPGPCKIQESFREGESQGRGGKSFGKKGRMRDEGREEEKNEDLTENVPRMEFV